MYRKQVCLELRHGLSETFNTISAFLTLIGSFYFIVFKYFRRRRNAFHAFVYSEIRFGIRQFKIGIILHQKRVIFPRLLEYKICSGAIVDSLFRVWQYRARHRRIENTERHGKHQKYHHKSLLFPRAENLQEGGKKCRPPEFSSDIIYNLYEQWLKPKSHKTCTYDKHRRTDEQKRINGIPLEHTCHQFGFPSGKGIQSIQWNHKEDHIQIYSAEYIVFVSGVSVLYIYNRDIGIFKYRKYHHGDRNQNRSQSIQKYTWA